MAITLLCCDDLAITSQRFLNSTTTRLPPSGISIARRPIDDIRVQRSELLLSALPVVCSDRPRPTVGQVSKR